jgi:hypothetical protein
MARKRILPSVILVLAAGAMLVACSPGHASQPSPVSGRQPAPRGLALPSTLDGGSEHELRAIYLACNETARVRKGLIHQSSIGDARAYWEQLRELSSSMAEGTAVRVWATLIDKAGDRNGLDDLYSTCLRSGY